MVEYPQSTIIRPESLAELLALLSTDRLDKYKLVWRGVGDISYRFDSGLVRRLAKIHHGDQALGGLITETEVADEEKRMLAEARRLGYGRSGPIALTDDELLVRLQHQGAATRLIDVTSNAFIALWMAVHDAENEDVEGALFGIDWTLTEDQHLPGATVAQMVERRGVTWLYEPHVDYEVRVRAQGGRFLLGAVPEDPRDRIYSCLPLNFPDHRADRLFAATPGGGRYPKSPVFILALSPNLKRDVARFLERILGMRTETVYPDLAGFARAYTV